jgi:hypothetical protein
MLKGATARIEARLRQLNWVLPDPPRPAGMCFDGFCGLMRVDGYVASAPRFTSQPWILDGASECLIAVLGPQLGAHTRTAFAVSQLPLDAPIELAVTFATNGAGQV